MKSYKFKINGTDYSVDINNAEGQTIDLTVNGKAYQVEMDKAVKPTKKAPVVVKRATPAAAAPAAAPSAPAASAAPAAAGAGALKSPLPGTILDIFVKEGDHVTVGQKLINLEAMKMENILNADVEGTVKTVNVRKGDAILEGALLLTIE